MSFSPRPHSSLALEGFSLLFLDSTKRFEKYLVMILCFLRIGGEIQLQCGFNQNLKSPFVNLGLACVVYP